MPLNLTTGGDFLPFIKYNAKLGQWLVKVDKNQPDVVVANPRFAMDMKNVKQGWLNFGVSGLQAWWWEAGVRTPMPEGIPVKDGFQVILYGPDPQPALGNKPIGLRQWTSNANATKEGFVTAYSEWEQNAGQHPGELPVFQMTGATRIPGANGDSFAPVFTLTGWVERSKIPGIDETAAAPPATPVDDWQAPQPGEDYGAQVDPDLDDKIPF